MKKLNFYQIDILLYALKNARVCNIFIKEAVQCGWEKHEAEQILSETKKTLTQNLVNSCP